jgi:F-box domain
MHAFRIFHPVIRITAGKMTLLVLPFETQLHVLSFCDRETQIRFTHLCRRARAFQNNSRFWKLLSVPSREVFATHFKALANLKQGKTGREVERIPEVTQIAAFGSTVVMVRSGRVDLWGEGTWLEGGEYYLVRGAAVVIDGNRWHQRDRRGEVKSWAPQDLTPIWCEVVAEADPGIWNGQGWLGDPVPAVGRECLEQKGDKLCLGGREIGDGKGWLPPVRCGGRVAVMNHAGVLHLIGDQIRRCQFREKAITLTHIDGQLIASLASSGQLRSTQVWAVGIEDDGGFAPPIKISCDGSFRAMREVQLLDQTYALSFSRSRKGEKPYLSVWSLGDGRRLAKQSDGAIDVQVTTGETPHFFRLMRGGLIVSDLTTPPLTILQAIAKWS